MSFDHWLERRGGPCRTILLLLWDVLERVPAFNNEQFETKTVKKESHKWVT
jgi:hypothetical protein